MNELIEAAKAVIDRWDSTDWKAAPTYEVMNRLRGALSKEPAKLPEVEEWIAQHTELTIEPWETPITCERAVVSVSHLKPYIATLTAAHAAELNNLHAQIGDLLATSATAKPSMEAGPFSTVETVTQTVLVSPTLGCVSAIVSESAKPAPCCGEYATCLRACTPRGEWMTMPAKLPEMKEQTPTDIYIAKLTAEIDALKKQLPAEMQHCTIVAKECAVGHGWLTATNWIQHGCRQCKHAAELAEKDAEIERLKRLLTIYFKAQQEETK